MLLGVGWGLGAGCRPIPDWDCMLPLLKCGWYGLDTSKSYISLLSVRTPCRLQSALRRAPYRLPIAPTHPAHSSGPSQRGADLLIRLMVGQMVQENEGILTDFLINLFLPAARRHPGVKMLCKYMYNVNSLIYLYGKFTHFGMVYLYFTPVYTALYIQHYT